jgi:hypothetical protein
MCAERDTSGAFTLLLSPDIKFMNAFKKKKKNIESFNIYNKISLCLSNIFTIDHRYIVSRKVYISSLLNADVWRARCSTVSSASDRISRRTASQL